MALFRCASGGGAGGEITVTYGADFYGATITCTRGLKVYSKTATSSGSVEFTVDEEGDWLIESTIDGTTYSATVSVTFTSSTELTAIPDGETVLPTDDIETWLACAQITGKSYTTLSQVLDDAETYERLLSDSNACDYMARSTTWALAEGQVPTMTSDTTPSGECLCGTYQSGYEAYKVFDGDSESYWVASGSSNIWVGYEFPSETIVSSYYVKFRPSVVTSCTHQLQGYDGTNWVDIGSSSTTLDGRVYVSNNTAYQRYRLSILAQTVASSGYSYGQILTLQFYEADITTSQDAMMRLGKYDYACDALLADSTWCTAICGSTYFEYVLTYERGLVPVMTSNTTPSGECFGSAYESTANYYLAFDNDSATMWSSGERSPNYSYVGYSFSSSKKVRIAVITNRLGIGATWKIQGSSDKSSWSDLTSDVTFNAGETKAIVLTTEGNVQHYRVYGKCTSNDWTNQLLSVQFYDRYEPQTDIIVTAHGGDTVYYMENGSPVTLTTADRDTGIGTVDWSLLPKGAITLYSSTAKNPSDLTADYSKTVYVNENTTQIYLMPDNALYWWGYESSDLEDCSTSNEWSLTGRTFTAPTHSTTYIQTTATNTSTFSGVGSKNSVTIVKTHAIAEGITADGGKYGTLYALSNKADFTTGNATHLTTSALSKIDVVASANYTAFGGITNRKAKVYALWYE